MYHTGRDRVIRMPKEDRAVKGKVLDKKKFVGLLALHTVQLFRLVSGQVNELIQFESALRKWRF